MNVLQLLKDKGWTIYDECYCGGTTKQQFKHKDYPGFLIEVKPMLQGFKILENHSPVTPFTYIGQFEKLYKQHILNEAT